VNDRHVAFSGGPGGIRHDASSEERNAMREQHMAATSVQQQHIQAARSDRSFYAKNNGGHPQTMAAERPMGFNNHGAQGNVRPQQQPSFNNNRGNMNGGGQNRPQYQNQPSRQPQYQQPRGNQPQYQQQPRGNQPQYQQQPHGNNQQPRNESRPAPQPRPQHEDKGPKEHK
jgi:hypothetical protein